MTVAEKLPTMTDREIAILRQNAERLSVEGGPRQKMAADELLPQIAAEQEARNARKPVPAAKAAAGTLKKPRKKAGAG